MKRRKIDPEAKMAAVLEGLRGASCIADICRKYQIGESLYYRWRDKFLAGGSQALGRSSAPSALGFADWTQVFGDLTLTAALLDRLTHKAHIVTCGGAPVALRQSLILRPGNKQCLKKPKKTGSFSHCHNCPRWVIFGLA